ncbi:DoxX family protein [Ancylomarina longa]|uniref:DoxX family protein n=1 Tax=Ancylomarina longa TaxID=2487017 RepID=A0A434AVY1_9BACT|nr:DoxX family protein [Ancylomarina longa]RUT78536.1 DoxX family protein [Ancylomarina longa]
MEWKAKFRVLDMLLRIVTAVILIQTLHFKFSGHPEAIHIFSTIGMEPWGRYGVGAIELIAGILFFIPRLWKLAAIITFGLMIVAIWFHLFTPLGIVIKYDGISDKGQLFGMALTALIFCMYLLYRANIPKTYRELRSKYKTLD